MSAHLEDRVALWLSTHPGSTVEQIARGVQSRNIAVREVLSGPLFTYSNVGGSRLYRVGLKAQDGLGRAQERPESDKEFLLRVLSDGEPHTLNEILRRSFADRGCGLTVHSRASDLRADGYRVENWKNGERGNGSWYRLTSRPLDEREPSAGEVDASFVPPPNSDNALQRADEVAIPLLATGDAEGGSRSSSGQTPPELEGLTDSTSGCSTVDTGSALSGAGDTAADSSGQMVMVGGAFGRRAAA